MKTALEQYGEARERFSKLATLTSAILLVMGAASRVPLLQISPPFDWLEGSFNVGFLPVFGPIIVFGAMCNLYLEIRRLTRLRAAALAETEAAHFPLSDAVLKVHRDNGADRRRNRVAVRGLHMWHFGVPVLA